MIAESSEIVELQASVSHILRAAVRNAVAKAGPVVRPKTSFVAGDVVTETDERIQSILKSQLTELLPESDFLGEEGFTGGTELANSILWVVDPLDGTLNFASQIPFFGASIALLEKGTPILGVVYDHSADLLYSAVRGRGAQANGKSFQWNAELARRSPVGVSSGYLARLFKNLESGVGKEEHAQIGSRYRVFGSQAVQLCWAAQGRLKININLESKLWDDAAGWLICREAGAECLALACHPLFPLHENSAALRGENLFSVSGSPEIVRKFQSIISE